MEEGEKLRDRALELAARPEVDVELAAGDLLQELGSDQAALEDAKASLERRSSAADDAARRVALDIVRTAIEVGYAGE